jgi:hypothetical protein
LEAQKEPEVEWLLIFGARLRGLFRKRQLDQELEAELRAHLDLRTEENMRRGMDAKEAAQAARREFGGVEQTKELYRGRRGLPFLETLLQDVRYSLRMLRKNPGFTAVVVLTLGLGIGANTAIFSVMEAVLLRPLPFPHPEELTMVWENVHLPHYENDQDTPAPGNFADWKNRNTVFSGMAAIGYRSWNLTETGEPVRIEGEAFSADTFSVLQTYPVLGRAFTAEEDRPSTAHVSGPTASPPIPPSLAALFAWTKRATQLLVSCRRGFAFPIRTTSSMFRWRSPGSNSPTMAAISSVSSPGLNLV